MSTGDNAACLRHLLQRADPIPFFTIVPNITVDQFFKDFVVARGAPRTAYERAVNYHLLTAQMPKVTVNQILSPLKFAKFEQKKEIRTLSRFSRISRVFGQTERETGPGRALVEKALAFVLLEPHL
jgi:hypothetical protein